jgi:hypothetical protein
VAGARRCPYLELDDGWHHQALSPRARSEQRPAWAVGWPYRRCPLRLQLGPLPCACGSWCPPSARSPRHVPGRLQRGGPRLLYRTPLPRALRLLRTAHAVEREEARGSTLVGRELGGGPQLWARRARASARKSFSPSRAWTRRGRLVGFPDCPDNSGALAPLFRITVLRCSKSVWPGNRCPADRQLHVPEFDSVHHCAARGGCPWPLEFLLIKSVLYVPIEIGAAGYATSRGAGIQLASARCGNVAYPLTGTWLP